MIKKASITAGSEPVYEQRQRGVWILILTLTLPAFLFFVFRIYNLDIWWHMATGKWIVAHGALPVQDPFSFASQPHKPWLILSWLFAPLSYGIHTLAGVNGLILFKALEDLQKTVAINPGFEQANNILEQLRSGRN